MKRVLVLVSFSLMSASTWASTVLWAGIAEAGWLYDSADAVVEENGVRTPVDQYHVISIKTSTYINVN